ncbi:glucosamine-6-phosphate deaminase [Spirosoma humi]
MKVIITPDKYELGNEAAKYASELIREAILVKGQANIILATGTSQFETLDRLTSEDIDWSKVTMFHLDEYVDLPVTHRASFRKYLSERFIEKVSPLKAVHLINGEGDTALELENLNNIISQHPIDVALVGIGENGHLAFNDPPADFDNQTPYLLVNLDELCRKQQLGEGWFTSFDQVPRQAISMSVSQIMKSKYIICSVPDERKALAVSNSLQQQVSNHYPASILQTHPACTFFLDKSSSSLLSSELLAEIL